jgi:aminoglycoside 3-N-acetyltransferase
MTPETEIEIQLADNLTALGVRKGGVLLVHSSLRSVGKVAGGAETVVRGMLRALGENGTLLMPALSYATVDLNNPVFHHQKTPACVGALPEYFRTRPGTIRSIHPTHSVSGVGSMAESLLKDNHLDSTPCGPHSAFHRLRGVKGQVLFLGCGMRPNTSMHAVEELAKPPYLFGVWMDYRIILDENREITMRVRRHGFTGLRQRYDRLAQVLDHDGLKRGEVLQATCHLVDCEQMWEHGLTAMKRNPFFFVERV